MRWFRVFRRVVLFAAVLVAVAACASKGLPPAQRVANTQQASDTTAASGGGDQPADPEAAKAEITKLYGIVFDGANPDVNAKLAVVDKGESVRDSFLKALNANKATFDVLTAKVNDIKFTSPTEATITFDLLAAGTPTLEGFQGKAILKDGKWYLEAGGLCDLVALADSSLPCNPS